MLTEWDQGGPLAMEQDLRDGPATQASDDIVKSFLGFIRNFRREAAFVYRCALRPRCRRVRSASPSRPLCALAPTPPSLPSRPLSSSSHVCIFL